MWLAQVSAEIGTLYETLDSMVDGTIALVPKLIIGIVVFGIFFLAAGWVKNLVKGALSTAKTAEGAAEALGRISRWVMIMVGFLVAATVVVPSISPADLLGVLGVSGVAIGFAFKDIFQNLLAGILILVRQPFSVGDQIVSGSYEGTVKDIRTRATVIDTYDGRRIEVPNSQIYTEPVEIKTAYDSIRSQYDIGIGYGDDIEEAKKQILEAVTSVEGVLPKPAPEVLTVELAGSSVNLRARWHTKSRRTDVVHVFDRVLTAIKYKLDDAAIDMPYPTNVVLFHDQTEATDGDRTKQREGWPAGSQPPEPRGISDALLDLREVIGKSARNGS